MRTVKVISYLRKKRIVIPLACLSLSLYFVMYIVQHTATATRKLNNLVYSFDPVIIPDISPIINSSQFIHRSQEVARENSTSVTNVGYGSCSMLKATPVANFKQEQYDYFTDKFILDKEPVVTWLDKSRQQSMCNENVKMYDGRFSVLKHVILNPLKIANIGHQAKGGEEVRQVLRQGLDKEDYRFLPGFLNLYCTENSPIVRSKHKMMNSVTFRDVKNVDEENITDITKQFEFEAKFTVAIVRIDYANLHNWAREVFNVLLILMFYNVQPKDAVVLFLDGHPFSNLDKTWENMFGTVRRVGHLNGPIWFRHLALGFEESDGIVSNFKDEKSAYLEECRAFILQQHNLNPSSPLKCSTPTITLLIRRNAVFHPRNVEGKVGRKIYNEAQLIDALMTSFPGACVQGVLMESLPMKSQLQIISQTDILIGMHGAGMTHSLFLPQHAVILELFAKDFKKGRPWFACYNSIARWRDLKYEFWENFDSASEMPFDFTIVPVEIIVNKTQHLLKQICNNQN